MRNATVAHGRAEPDPLVLGAGTWLACGGVLAGLTPLPLHDATTGWSLAFWLLAAPLVVLLARRFVLAAGSEPGARARQRSRLPVARPRGPLRRHAATPRRLASIRRRNSCMIRR